jgi:hypothetical protein
MHRKKYAIGTGRNERPSLLGFPASIPTAFWDSDDHGLFVLPADGIMSGARLAGIEVQLPVVAEKRSTTEWARTGKSITSADLVGTVFSTRRSSLPHHDQQRIDLERTSRMGNEVPDIPDQ